jgi:fermentation-respiration switch protein FrsA (DUF1100 family)
VIYEINFSLCSKFNSLIIACITLFQFALNDEFVSVRDGERYFELASEPKQIAWYDNCGHAFNTQARVERVFWLCSQLGLARPSEEIIHLLERVPSPIPLEDYIQAFMEAKSKLED